MSATQPATQLIDTSVMPTLHTFFRREFRLPAPSSAVSPEKTSPGPASLPTTSTS